MRTTGGLASKGYLLLLALVGMFATAYLLPTDTALRDVRRAGVLRACVPNSYPVLVSGDEAMPGVDLEILRRVSENLGVRLLINRVSAIGRDFNPRNWRVTRAQCQIIGGGVIETQITRTFLDVTQAHLETGWAFVMRSDDSLEAGDRVGFFSPISGLPRVELSRLLRTHGVTVVNVADIQALLVGLESGEFGAILTEALIARTIANGRDFQAVWLTEDFETYPVAFGLWKGDLTLKRAVNRELATLERTGELAAILERYELDPIEGVCNRCPW